MFEQSSIVEGHGEGTTATNHSTAPSLIECLITPLGKVGDLIPQTYRFAWWEEFGKESSSKLIPCSDAPPKAKNVTVLLPYP